HSPRLSSKLMSLTAQNSSGRSTPSAPCRLPSSSLPMSCMPYHMDFLRLRQNFLDSPSTLISVSPMSASHPFYQYRHGQTEHDPEYEQQYNSDYIDQHEIAQVFRRDAGQPVTRGED